MKSVAIYLTNTDRSEFAARNDSDALKVIKRLKGVGAEFDFTVFDVTEGEFADDLTRFDAFIVTGSPAFVDDDNGWITRLLDDIRTLHAANVPLVGLCFGHQAIIAALGGTVGKKDFWIFGGTEFDVFDTRPWMTPGVDGMKLYAANKAQALTLPEGFDLLGGSESCPIALTACGDSVFTTQFHPEMSDEFIVDLIEEYSDGLGDAADAARKSVEEPAQGPLFGEWIRNFIELDRG